MNKKSVVVVFFLFEIESTCSEDAMKTVEMTTNNLEYHINLVNKTTVGLERTDSNVERNSTVGNCYKTSFHSTEKLLKKGRVN